MNLRTLLLAGMLIHLINGSPLLGGLRSQVKLLDETSVQAILKKLPRIADAEIDRVIRADDTLWYDKATMVPSYQDSIYPVIGARPNTVNPNLVIGYDDIFEKPGFFHFPFGHTAGTDTSINVEILTFWAPPRLAGKILPVVIRKAESTRLHWLFPKGTIFGELMMVKSPEGESVPFEIRVRKRYRYSWGVNAFRPFPTAKSLARSVERLFPHWREVPSLAGLAKHLDDSSTLKPTRKAAQHYAGTFEPINGALDLLPEIEPKYVKTLLKQTPFQSADGALWKEGRGLETFAASTDSAFHIVPRQYQGGLYGVNEMACMRCHKDAGRQIGQFYFRSLLYGEIWGEDQIFSWHPLDTSYYPNFNTENRHLRKDFVDAGLVATYRLSEHPSTLYHEIEKDWTYTPW